MSVDMSIDAVKFGIILGSLICPLNDFPDIKKNL
jgi:hypothetical protein